MATTVRLVALALLVTACSNGEFVISDGACHNRCQCGHCETFSYDDTPHICSSLPTGEQYDVVTCEGTELSTFPNLTQLQFQMTENQSVLSLHNNGIASLTPGTIMENMDAESEIASHLKVLHLGLNHMGPEPSMFWLLQLNNLERLSLDNNGIRSLEHFRIGKNGRDFVSALRHLSLEGNSITRLPPYGFDSFPDLEELVLSFALAESAQINRLAFGHLNRLMKLDLNSNRLTTAQIGRSLEPLRRGLIWLDLSFNSIGSEGLRSLLNFSNLLHLSLAYNRLTHLANGELFQLCDSLQSLQLQGNQLVHLEQNAFTFLNNLTVLDLSHNPLLGIEDWVFNASSELTELDLSFTHLELIGPYTLAGLTSLEKLTLFSARVARLEGLPFRHMESTLLQLDLGNNALSWLGNTSSFGNMSRLSWLSLSGNGLQGFEKATFTGLQVLKQLSLTDNLLTSINRCAFCPHQVLYIEAERNPIRCTCDLKWFLDVQSRVQLSSGSTCATPSEFHKQTVNSLSKVKLCTKIPSESVCLFVGCLNDSMHIEFQPILLAVGLAVTKLAW